MKSLLHNVKFEFETAPVRTAYYGAGVIVCLISLIAAIITYQNVLTEYVLPVVWVALCFIHIALVHFGQPARAHEGYTWQVIIHTILLVGLSGLLSTNLMSSQIANLIEVLHETNVLSAEAQAAIAKRFRTEFPLKFHSVLLAILSVAYSASLARYVFSSQFGTYPQEH